MILTKPTISVLLLHGTLGGTATTSVYVRQGPLQSPQSLLEVWGIGTPLDRQKRVGTLLILRTPLTLGTPLRHHTKPSILIESTN